MGLGLQMSVLEGLKEALRWQHLRSANQEKGEPNLVRHTDSCMASCSKSMHVITVHSLPNLSGHPDPSRMPFHAPGCSLSCSSMVAHCRPGKQNRGSERRRLCTGRHPERLTKLEAFLSGGLARTVAAAATCPFTVVKTRMEFTGSGQPVQVGRASTESCHAPLGVLQNTCSE